VYVQDKDQRKLTSEWLCGGFLFFII
jgi:hypothetical protein